jgi:hypothetical protein
MKKSIFKNVKAETPTSKSPLHSFNPSSQNSFSTYRLRAAILFAAFFLVVTFAITKIAAAQQPAATSQTSQTDPAAWGSNHAGKPVPEYVSGGECLFCHRNTIGATWQANSHGITIRQHEDAPELKPIFQGQEKLAPLVKEIEYYLGSRHRLRFLKKNGYGKFSILNTQAEIGANAKVLRWLENENPVWDKEKFANRCVGCHATGIETKDKTFSAFGHDCYVCHGVVNLEHTNDISLIWLSKKRKSDALAVTSICASCHLREGKSKSSGLPYANNFVAGDNLFQDYQVDWSKADDEALNPGDRHIYRNVRDVVLNGKQTTCLNCHAVHANSSSKHRLTAKTQICSDCHDTEKSIYKPAKQYTVKSALCEY